VRNRVSSAGRLIPDGPKISRSADAKIGAPADDVGTPDS
jgi:hypothetical protein